MNKNNENIDEFKLEQERLESDNTIDIFEAFKVLKRKDKTIGKWIKHWLKKNIYRLLNYKFDIINQKDDKYDE